MVKERERASCKLKISSVLKVTFHESQGLIWYERQMDGKKDKRTCTKVKRKANGYIDGLIKRDRERKKERKREKKKKKEGKEEGRKVGR